MGSINTEASQRIYLLRQRKCTCIDCVFLVQFNFGCIHPFYEYALQAFYVRLPGYISDEIERIQKQALRIMYPEFSYREALADN